MGEAKRRGKAEAAARESKALQAARLRAVETRRQAAAQPSRRALVPFLAAHLAMMSGRDY
jgi:hypothetical protein